MKNILFIITLIIITGCSDNRNPYGSYNSSKSSYMKTIVIDSCEYIDGYNRFSHKGNCVYCKNRREKEIEELINKLKED